ncbi:MAG: hypothetical protein NVS1B14_08450 [Vulcanimicrobiaceae bacterium]
MLSRFVLAPALAFAMLAPAGAECSRLAGHRVTLVSNNYDPDVFVWDTRLRLMDYAAGGWRVARALLPHALLVHAGTPAIVTACSENVVHPKYQFAPTDAVGVKITNGRYHGRYGWILVGDLRVRR